MVFQLIKHLLKKKMVLFRVSKTGKQPKESIKHTTGNKMVNRCVQLAILQYIPLISFNNI